MLRIGVLTPRSSLYPTIGFDIINGLKTGFAQMRYTNETTIITDNIGFGIDEAEIYTKAEKMLLGDNADIVIACCDSRIAAMLQPLFTTAGKLLLVTNPGANLPEGWQASPNTIVHSLNFCFNTSLTGSLPAANNTAAMATSYYDAGYNQVYCMVTSFQQNGGQMLYNHVTHLKDDQFTLAPLRDFMAGENPAKNLLCLFSGDMAARFYHEMAEIQQNQRCNLYVSPMMLEEGMLTDLGNEITVDNIQGYTPWLSTLSNTNNQQFVAAWQTAYGKQPNIFALQGWDTALIIEQFTNQLQLHNNHTANAVKAMGSGAAMASPRGWIKLDPASNHIYGPAWLVKSNGNFIIEIEENSSTDIEAEWKKFTSEMALSPTEIHSAWRNTYLCI
jgi:branched-chain amino acid transport system substrate-binding protein